MIKKTIKYLLYFLILITIGVFYLSYYGIETKRFNQIIKDKISENNNKIDIELNNVRITHIPTKIVVQCQNERSQHKNKEPCMNMLKARLYDFEIKKKEQESKNLESIKSEIGWGHQIRSYVLHPYRLVKDNRTNYESSNPDKVLDGSIDDFLESSLYKIND